MNRYDNLGNELLMMPNEFGEWVKHRDIEKLKELNREMYDTLKDVHFYLQQIGSVGSLLKNSLYQAQESAIRKMLIKVEGREDEGE